MRVQGGAASEREIADFFAAASPHLTEILEVSTDRVHKWLLDRAKKLAEAVGKAGAKAASDDAGAPLKIPVFNVKHHHSPDEDKPMPQPGFFDLDERYARLNERDPLVKLNQIIDWEAFREPLSVLRNQPRKSQAGRKPYDVVLMFKILVLQHLYNVCDDDIEYQIRDRHSFCRFLGRGLEDKIPDARTIWLFREQLTRHELHKTLFERFDQQLVSQGCRARKGQIIDASFVDVPRQRNSREENAQLKAGETPERFEANPSVKAQKDTQARWARKNQETHFGYKNHIAIDNQHKLIRAYEVTSAEVHDSQKLLGVLSENTSRDLWADSAYRSQANEEKLAARGLRSHIHKKGQRNKPLSEAQKRANTRKSKVRVRVEHVFGSMTNEQGGLYFRVIGLARTATKIGLMNLVYNMRRLVQIDKLRASGV